MVTSSRDSVPSDGNEPFSDDLSSDSEDYGPATYRRPPPAIAHQEPIHDSHSCNDDDDNDDDQEQESSEDEDISVAVLAEIDQINSAFHGFKTKYKLINRIGQGAFRLITNAKSKGTFSSVYKAEDLCYGQHNNDWDLFGPTLQPQPSSPARKKLKFAGRNKKHKLNYVAVKKIYVTSGPARIYNELEILHDLKGSNKVVPLITALRHQDQIVAILPYFKHTDFQEYYRDLSLDDIRIYFHSLFKGLQHVHSKGIIHRDVKPSNFLYDPIAKNGVLVDFGLAERERHDSKLSWCRCYHGGISATRSIAIPEDKPGYLRNDTRPGIRANRAGTRGFRAPEVLLKCTSQTSKLDVWSAGVIFLSILGERFPFFHSSDDIDALLEIAAIFGKTKIKKVAHLHNRSFETSIPSINDTAISFLKLKRWCKNEHQGSKERVEPAAEEALALGFLAKCMEPDVNLRVSATEALEHSFFMGLER
ncbi:Cell cycle serine/threonine-protein kinase hsk1 [Neolecta irregularis DAH-3]|uniref:non-specific serine/threonine protein kinase n=1 Tax=Neolecta irregularis (strain DAH-3) TaxID=1198029 RepID=A0A1U7LHQ9_NEOID|nr:Cell cycle serine/threonine-protein kinase hsk1 [Neolecta irregularis DAH-3]|eukprot:OLL22187.1 Cell cycle serine/threonine-protein kinase hsk1 [Neolecta irregularis DAH-3]